MRLFGKWYIGKERGGKGFRKTSNGFGIGPLVIWKARYEIYE